jgi:hypothetical protein
MQLQSEFAKYLVEHPEFDSQIPNDAHIVFMPDHNAELRIENGKLIGQIKREGGKIAIVRVKGLLPEKSRLIDPTVEAVLA